MFFKQKIFKFTLLLVVLSMAGIPLYTWWIEKKEREEEYLEKIEDISSNSVIKLLGMRGEMGASILFYVYGFDCSICSANIGEFNKMVREFNGKGIVFLAVALGEDKQELASHLAEYLEELNFKPLIMHPSEERKMELKLNSLHVKYKKVPYLGLLHPTQQITEIPTGVGREEKIRKILQEATF